MSGYRCNEPGWRLAALPDGRRGIWYREVREHDVLVAIELCAGREGDDAFVRLDRFETLDSRALGEIAEIFSRGAWSCELRADEVTRERGPLAPGDAGLVRDAEASALELVADRCRDLAARLRGARGQESGEGKSA